MNNPIITAVIVEDNKRTADLLRAYIESNDVHINTVYYSAEAVLAEYNPAHVPDIMLVDIDLPGISGIELIREIRKKTPCPECIMLTILEDTATIIKAIKAGASGYVLKSAPREEILAAIQEAVRGGSFLSGKVARYILGEIHSPAAPDKQGHATDEAFTERETDVLNAIVAGHSYKEIAGTLGISFHTVNNHIRRIYEKLQVHSRGEATAKIMQQQ
jgi:DNA-binding NarL/FixJ family response regulator